MKRTVLQVVELLSFCFLALVSSTPLPETVNKIDLSTGFARCYDLTEASTRAPVDLLACEEIAIYLRSNPDFQTPETFTADHPLPSFSADGCVVVVHAIRAGASDSFSLALVGVIATIVSSRCADDRRQVNRGGFGLVGNRNAFRVEVYQPPAGTTITGAKKVSVKDTAVSAMVD